MLFSEPKISQSRASRSAAIRRRLFQCSSASRKFLNRRDFRGSCSSAQVSVLFSEPKISQCQTRDARTHFRRVSVLFSEPKISQSSLFSRGRCGSLRFSALQRAENFSIRDALLLLSLSHRFQCSSASRKFLNLQFLEIGFASTAFQCSSASRKFLNAASECGRSSPSVSFSALQRAENFSIRDRARTSLASRKFQCSSASRKFLNLAAGAV